MPTPVNDISHNSHNVFVGSHYNYENNFKNNRDGLRVVRRQY